MTEQQALTEQQVAQVKDEFNFFDRDDNGRIDLEEFTELLTALSPKTKDAAVAEAFSMIDENGDGHIDFDEFLAWWQQGWWEY
ncbi:Calmodulin [Saliniradius amylolyticus]|uniref:Calmodulin n=1 Tax=Saliniradius amylolyticus TaxID=2183582 RepID=A0A2S2E2Z4_9ALTE|nr:EF-hand domain-containing protein [Saliniradius amylolyticus]AWL12014.1 Calmodulin [Saliniradius amylolyticus]